MKLISTVVRPERLPQVKAALFRAGVTGITISRVSGHGGERELQEHYRGGTVVLGVREKVRLEIAVSVPLVEPTLNPIPSSASLRPGAPPGRGRGATPPPAGAARRAGKEGPPPAAPPRGEPSRTLVRGVQAARLRRGIVLVLRAEHRRPGDRGAPVRPPAESLHAQRAGARARQAVRPDEVQRRVPHRAVVGPGRDADPVERIQSGCAG